MAEAETKERTQTATDYVVLERREFKDDSSGETTVAWVEAGTASGTTRVGVALEIAGEGRAGFWRPVPLRNWADTVETYVENRPKTRARVVKS